MSTDHPEIENLPEQIDGITIRETIRHFFRNPINGSPDSISKVGCSSLIKLSQEEGAPGKMHLIWNTWRIKFPAWSPIENTTNFEGHTFYEDMDLRFFDFGYAANFRKTIFKKRAFFDHSTFRTSTDFSCSYWLGQASFKWTKWENDIRFHYSYWYEHSNFLGSHWISANFAYCKWMKGVDFSGTGWSDSFDFSGCYFHSLSMEGHNWAYLESRFFDDELLFQQIQNYAKRIGTSPTDSALVIFSGSFFAKDANFSNRSFKKSLYFNAIELHNPYVEILRDENGLPILNLDKNIQFLEDNSQSHFVEFQGLILFHGSIIHQDTSFAGAIFPDATGSENTARAYRTLKLAFSSMQAVREEQRFFRLEMAEEAKQHENIFYKYKSECQWLKALKEYIIFSFFRTYSLVADYGFSVTRPILFLILNVIIFANIYGIHQGYSICLIGNNCNFRTGWYTTALLHSMPFSGMEKLCQGCLYFETNFLFTISFVVYKVISLIALFLIGLALRNLFKLK